MFARSLPESVDRSRRGRSIWAAPTRRSTSALDQINKSNVAQLEVAWTYPTGDTRSYRFNPIVVDGTMYVLAKDNAIVALDAATGQEMWTHPNEGAVGERGINYWESADGSDRRLLYLNAGSLTAIDARTGNDDSRRSATTAASTCASACIATSRSIRRCRPATPGASSRT